MYFCRCEFKTINVEFLKFNILDKPRKEKLTLIN